MSDERSVDFRARTIAARSPVLLQELRAVAKNLLSARRALRSAMPAEFFHSPGIDLLFTLFVADEHMMASTALVAATPVSPHVARRWIDVFVDRDLVALRGGAIVLTESGFRMIADACQAIIESQTNARIPRLN